MNRRQINMGLAASALAVAATAAVLWAVRRADPPPAPTEHAAALASAPVTSSASAEVAGYPGVVQAVRLTTVAAQVSGAVVTLDVKAGDAVKGGQVLLRLDGRAAEQAAAAGAAQVRSARVTLEAAERELARQKQLFEKNYISQAAFDRAEALFKGAQADASAQLASAGAAHTQSDFYAIRAPYAGVVSEVPVVLGDMAMPGRALVTLYDPAALRVSAAIPESAASRVANGATVIAEVPGAPETRFVPARAQVMPAVDAATHTQELRLELPLGTRGVAPGMFARILVPAADPLTHRLFVPGSALVRRAELAAVYVIGPDGEPLLRQVRPGRADGDLVEILSGVSAGERVALNPQAAAAAH
jgi:membrane fusion protein, multidrug efflux system